MLVSGANMSGITKRLERIGCIIRSTDPNDERSKWLEITKEGKQLVNGITEEMEMTVKKYLKSCADEKKSEVLSVLRDLIRNS
jgi:DNA-binding MarR family transcriptional regulator